MKEDFAALAEEKALYAFLEGKRIYITGATGQIGWYLTHLLNYLNSHHDLDCSVTAHVRSQHRLTEKFPDHQTLPTEFVISEDASSALLAHPFDMVIHCASHASPKHFDATPVNVMIPNGILTHGLLDKIKENNPACQFVYLSTTGVTGFVADELRPTSEEEYGPLSSIDLKNCYLESKRFGEMLTLAYTKQFGIPSLVVRPSITYGPGFDLDDGRSYADFINTLLDKKPIKLSSDGRAIRNFLYISDFIRGLLLAINKAASGAVINIASPKPTRILDLATLLTSSIYPESLGEVDYVKTSQEKMARVEFLSTDASVEKLSQLGWEQRVATLDGFRRTLQHYQETMQ
jgi:dTDP-glucose 4,6-dehydratase